MKNRTKPLTAWLAIGFFVISFGLAYSAKERAAEQNLLTFIRFADALEADVTCGGGGQDQVVECDPGQLLDHGTRRVPQIGAGHPLLQRLPHRISQEAEEDVGLDAVSCLVPDRTQAQLALVRAKGRFGLRQLDVGLPEVLGRPVAQVGSQEVAAFRKHRPLTPLLFFCPRHLQAGTTVTFDCIHTNVEQARRATVLTQQTADLSLHFVCGPALSWPCPVD